MPCINLATKKCMNWCQIWQFSYEMNNETKSFQEWQETLCQLDQIILDPHMALQTSRQLLKIKWEVIHICLTFIITIYTEL